MTNPLDGYTIKFNPGHCFVCEKKIDSGIYCPSCLADTKPVGAIKIPVNFTHAHQLTIVAELENGFGGFVTPASIFYFIGRYWIFNNAIVSNYLTTDFAVKIRKSLTGTLYIVAETLYVDQMGSMNSDNQRLFTPVELETAQGEPVSSVKTARYMKVSEMVDGDQGFTEPYAIFEMGEQLYIISTAGVLFSKDDPHKTMEVRKRNGRIEINLETISTEDIIPGYAGIEDEMAFEKATPVPHF